jgi:hypothetical protein
MVRAACGRAVSRLALAGVFLLISAGTARADTKTLTLQITAGVGAIASDVAGVGCERPAATDPAPTTCPFTVDANAVVKLTAAPGPGYRHEIWNPGTECSVQLECTVDMRGFDQTRDVGFPPAGRLRIITAGHGTVTASPPGVLPAPSDYPAASTCPSPESCELDFVPGTQVALAAAPDAALTPDGHRPSFARWSPLECPGVLDCRVTVGADPVTVAATFDPLRVGVLASGNGSVTSDPSGIDCPAVKCSLELPVGTPVTLTAHSGEAVEWTTGCDSVQGARCEASASADPWWVGVRFGTADPPGIPPRIGVTFRVLHGGSGRGVVQGRRINCGNTCSADYTFGEREHLVADPSSGSVFAGWHGACARDPVCVVPVGPVDAVRAIFDTVGSGDGSGRGGGGGKPRLSVRGLRIAVRGHGRRRAIIVRVAVNRAARATLRLTRGRRVLARATYRLHRGANRLRLRVRRPAGRGRARIVLRVSSAGRTRTVARGVRLPR